MVEYGRYQGLSVDEIEADLRSQGFNPIRDEDEPGFVYEPHSHAEVNIIVVLDGEMEVKVGETSGTLRSGDKVTFPAGIVHSSRIGPQGCIYFWVELPA